jgi:hypothetical protein
MAIRQIVEQGLEAARRVSRLQHSPPKDKYFEAINGLHKVPADGDKPRSDLQKLIEDEITTLQKAVPTTPPQAVSQAAAPSPGSQLQAS